MEIWRDIPGYVGSYQVSNLGNVRSLDRYVAANHGRRLLEGQLLRQTPKKGGYLHVALSLKQRAKYFTVHTLVMLAFEGPRPRGLDTCHVDGNSANNAFDNLYYGTRKQNHADKRRHGTMACGERINTSRLTKEQVLEIRYRRASGETVESIAKDYGVSSVTISKIAIGDTWKHIGGPIVERMKRTYACCED